MSKHNRGFMNHLKNWGNDKANRVFYYSIENGSTHIKTYLIEKRTGKILRILKMIYICFFNLLFRWILI